MSGLFIVTIIAILLLVYRLPSSSKVKLGPSNTHVPVTTQPVTEVYKSYPSEDNNPGPWYVGTWGVGEPSYAEQLIIDELNKYNIEWHREVSFKDLISPSTGGNPRFDFYLPKYKIAIEYHGQGYHESPERLTADKIKEDYCTTNCIILYVYRVEQYRNMERAVASLMHSIGVLPIK